MYWTVFAKMLGDEDVQFTFYRHGGDYLESQLGQTPIAEVDIWCGEKRVFSAKEVFPILIKYFAEIACDASAHAKYHIELDINDQFREIQENGDSEFADGLDETAPYEVG